MLEPLYKVFTDKLSLAPDIWLYAMLALVVVAFIAALVAGLVAGEFVKTKAVMKSAVARPATALAALKKLPASVKTQYKNARMGNIKPSVLLTKQVCVDEPYKRSLVSKVWLVTLLATVFAAAMAWCLIPLSKIETGAADDIAGQIAAAAQAQSYMYIAPLVVLIVGGLFTVIGGIIGKAVYSGAVKLYGKFMPVIDGDQRAVEAGQAYSEPQNQAYAEPQSQAYAEPQQQYAEPQQAYDQAQPVYEQPQQTYAEPQQAYAEPQQQATYAEPAQPVRQESDEEFRRRAREEAMAQARAQQAQAQAQAQAQTQARPQTAGSSTVDDVIAQIDKIEREGAPRETMREVATLLQKERAKPENKTPERQKQLNEALSKLLKAMSGARK